MSDFLTAYQNSAELTGWIAYERIDEERQMNLITQAIARAFNGDKPRANAVVDDDDEEIIDTTQPEFVKQFKGFTGIPGRRT